MRITVEFDDDTARAVEAVRPPFRQRTARLGLRVDVSNVADALETLDGADAR